LTDGEAKGRDETLTEIDKKMVNQKDLSQIVTEVMLSEMIEMNKDVLDVAKKAISKETAWQKMSICTKRKR